MTIRLNWGTGLTCAYALFVVGTMTFVVFAARRPIALVRPDYYEASLKEDERIAAIDNVHRLGAASPTVTAADRRMTISIPPDQVRTARGTITLYRASDPTADRTFDFAPGPDGRQVVTLDRLPAGRWLVQLRWNADGRDYYLEQSISLP